ncbi:MAG: S9 family peptidase [Flavobacteriales bacterium]|nr:S9 family peptidase [Flavobacteriales bacterium]
MKIYFFYLAVFISIIGCNNQQKQIQMKIEYPETFKSDHVDTYFNVDVTDPYNWLEDDRSEETEGWVKAQNKVTHAYLDKIAYRPALKDRLEKLFDYERIYAPTKHGDFYYYYKNDGLQNQNVLYRTFGEDGEETVFIDPDSFSDDGTISLSSTSFTKNGSICSYLISEGGSDWRKCIVIATDSMAIIEDTLVDIKFSGISWKGNEGFYYSSYDKPKGGSELSGKTQFHKLFYHQLGTPQTKDQLVFGGESTPRRYVGAYVTESEDYLVITAATSTSGNELYIKDLSDDENPIIRMVEGFEKDHYVLENIGTRLIIFTNYDAPNNRLMEVDFSSPTIDNWKEFLPETENVLSANTGGGHIFASYMVDVKSEILEYDYDGNLVRQVELPGIGTVGGMGGYRDDNHLYFSYTSLIDPATIYKYDIANGTSELFRRPEIDFVSDDYVTEQVFFKSKDGTSIPMFIVYKKGIELNGENPTWMYSYGGFNVSLTPRFSTARIVWLENGGVYAQPNIRGGGEYGEKWHVAGTKLQKQNVFDDFIAAGEYLIENGYTNSSLLAMEGGSNGGLLVGAVMAQRPDLARVAFPAVGVMDMLKYHTFTSGAGWAFDYGTSEDSKEMFEYLLAYSPVHAIRQERDYPATMVTTADHDDRVVPAHSFKFAAQLQCSQKGDAPVLIRIETDAGHGAGTSITKIIDQQADKYAFAWYNMGIQPKY